MSNNFFKDLVEKAARHLLVHLIKKVDENITKQEAKEIVAIIVHESEERDNLKVFNKIGS